MRKLLSIVVLALTASACTKVIEQPQAAQAPPPPDPLRTSGEGAAKAPRAVQKSWGILDRERAGAPRVITNSNRLPDTLNGDPQGLSREQLNAAIQAVLPNLAVCFANSDTKSTTVSFEADPSGSPRGISVRGATAETDSCVRGIFGAIQFPRFKGNPVPIDYPISIHSTVVPRPAPAPPPPPPPPPAQAAPPAPPGPPPTFVAPATGNPTTVLPSGAAPPTTVQP